MAKKGRKQQHSNKLSRRPREPIWKRPPSYKSQPVRSWTIRCDVAGNAAEQVITTFQMSSVLAVIGVTAGTSVFMSDSWRCKRIDLWGWTSTIGTTTDIMLKFADNGTAAGQGGPPCTVMDSSASIDDPAFVSLKPPKGSICSLWQDTGAASYNFFTYKCPQSGIMDIHFEFIIDDIGTLVVGPVGTYVIGNIFHKQVQTLSPVSPLNNSP